MKRKHLKFIMLAMHPLVVLLLLSFPSFGIVAESNCKDGDVNDLLLCAYLCHEQFFTALTNHISIKVKNATQTTLLYSHQDIDQLLTHIDFVEYTFLQIFHSLSTGDLVFTNELIELYSTLDRKLRPSDYFKSHVTLLKEQAYLALNSIVTMGRNGLKPIPNEIIEGILSVTNKSSVFEEAYKRGNVGLIKWLQNHVSETERCSALETAWRQEKSVIVKMIIKSNETFVKPGMSVINQRNSEGENILHLAAESKNSQFVTRLIECGAQVNTSDAHGTTPLYRAVKNDDIVTAKILIENGADVNAATKSGNIPLHEAARNGNHEMVALLLASGSMVSRESDEGLTPLFISEKYAFRGVIEYMFLSNSVTVKKLPRLKFLYILTSYESDNRNTRRRKINLDHISEFSMITKDLLLRGDKTYIPIDLKSEVLYVLMELGITPLARIMLNIGAKLNPKLWDTKMIFRDAIVNNNHELVALMLNEGISVNTEYVGKSALELAADRGSVTTFNLLLTRGADITLIKNSSGSMLHAASGQETIVRYLLNNGSRVDTLDKDGNTPLFHAAIFGNPEIVKLLINHKANPRSRNSNNETALHYAAYGNDAKSISILIASGAEIEARGNEGETPLFVTAKNGNEAALSSLLELGAAIDVKDIVGRTPLEISILGHHINTTQVLLDNGMNPNAVDNLSKTMLHLAVSAGSVEIVEMLLKKGVLISTQDCDGRNSLHEAVAKKSLAIVKLLVAGGITINAKDKEGRTPLDYAITNCTRDIVSFLVKKGAKASVFADPKCIIVD